MGRWAFRTLRFNAKRAAEEPEPYRGIFYEPPYSIRHAAVSFGVIVIGRLLSWWVWGQ